MKLPAMQVNNSPTGKSSQGRRCCQSRYASSGGLCEVSTGQDEQKSMLALMGDSLVRVSVGLLVTKRLGSRSWCGSEKGIC